MLNQCALVGKVKELPIIKKTKNGNSTAFVTLEVEKNFRNSNGEVEFDIFNVQLWKGIAEDVVDFSKIGSVLAIRGRLVSRPHITDENTYYNVDIIAEKVNFIQV